MATRDFTLTLPEDVVTQLQAGELAEVSRYLNEAVTHQVRREAILEYLAGCEAAGHPPLTESDLREFRKLAGEESG